MEDPIGGAAVNLPAQRHDLWCFQACGSKLRKRRQQAGKLPPTANQRWPRRQPRSARTSGHEEGLGGVEVDAPHWAVVLVKAVDQRAHAVVPQLDDAAVQGGQDPWALGVEGQALHPAGSVAMAAQWWAGLAGWCSRAGPCAASLELPPSET
jgi:hypothetical protein